LYTYKDKEYLLPRRVLAQRPKPEEALLESPAVYIQRQRKFVEKVRSVFVVGEALSI